MDRKAWILLILCVSLLGANLWYGAQNQKNLKPDQQEQTDGSNSSGEPAMGTGDADTTAPPTAGEAEQPKGGAQVEAPAQIEETLHTLTTKRLRDDKQEELVEFTFTNRGGGVKFARFKQQRAVGHGEEEKLAEHEDKFVRLNTRHLRTVGTLALDPVENIFDTSMHQLVDKTDNSITFKGKTPSGLTVTKTYTLIGDSTDENLSAGYRLKLDVKFENPTALPISVNEYGIYAGSASPLHAGEQPTYGGFFHYTDGDFETEDASYFTGGFISSAKDGYLDRDLEDIKYAGVMNQFFATILTPSEPLNTYVWAGSETVELAKDDGEKVKKQDLSAALGLPKIELGPNAIQSFEFDLYMGPKNSQVLSSISSSHNDVMNYGWFWPVSWALNILLGWLHGIFGNWGWAVAGVTIIIRLCLWPIHNKSTRAMKRMQQLQPKMKALKEKHADDPQKMNMKVMELYRDYGVNPVGGCLPMLIQIPIFFGFYKMLMFAVELRNEGWIGWVTDLSQPDTITNLGLMGFDIPINILPILMAVTMVIQMKLAPKPADPMQAKIMMFMPIMFFVFCYNFASALALYWTTQNIFTIGQTLFNNRMPEPELKKRTPKGGGKPGKGKSFLQRMAEAQEAKMKEMQGAKKSGGMRQAGSNVSDDKKKKRGPKTGG